MKKLFVKIATSVQQYFINRSLKKAIKDANTYRLHTGQKQFVLWIHGEYRCISKQRLKRLIAEGNFKSGVTIQYLERHAAYTTT